MAKVTIPPTPVLTTPPPTSITRANDLTVTWTGGSANAIVEIQLQGATDSSGLTGAQIVCQVPSSVGTFTVPAYVLSALPAGPYGAFIFAPYLAEVPITATGLIDGKIETYLPGATNSGATLK
jgi:hypothetical protein